MKQLLFILCILALTGCFKQPSKTHNRNFNPKEEGLKFVNELKNQGVDTIITYFDGCSGCNTNFQQTFYVYWVDNKLSRIIKFNESMKFESMSYAIPIKYLGIFFDTLINEKIKISGYQDSHYSYSEMFIKIGDRELGYKIASYEKWVNELSWRVLMIDKFRSEIFGIKDYRWKVVGS